ncbi:MULTISPECIES: DUF5399 domain-containing protein [Parachlamydia]|jgi:hypothetical protein|uniref:Uncharacterized protein n=2 Tax=Parachlamydia acanthamoebae TaxID=83552 RepID=F8L0Z6_PARAV|nr:DUF5399 domain-containing protein [Parachlamydia acanthamoebae]KIA77398.1 hypothetical protein DB43_GJ00150 [Parachlamydia acanthamoebae]CCB86914.1 putative uncharacterized protein [Parachlamydia acanthamoebae UV-7]
MATIDQLDLSVYNLYAIRTKMLEQIDQQLSLKSASSIPPQTQIVDINPKLTELDILLGIVPLHTPWAYFYPPQRIRDLRRSPFAFYRVAPSLGSYEDQEELEATLAAIPCSTAEEEQEKKAITNCFKQISKINEWLGFIVGRIGQFLQG